MRRRRRSLRLPAQCAGRVRKVMLPPIRFSSKGKTMKYLVPPIVIPFLLFIGILAYGLLRPPIIAGHPSAPAANSQTR
jgi:hypothetical protein